MILMALLRGSTVLPSTSTKSHSKMVKKKSLHWKKSVELRNEAPVADAEMEQY